LILNYPLEIAKNRILYPFDLSFDYTNANCVIESAKPGIIKFK